MARTARKPALHTARMELRVPPSAKKFIQRAMAVSGRSAADIVYEGAKRILEEHERMVLSGANEAAFLAAVRNPPNPSERLVLAIKKRGEFEP